VRRFFVVVASNSDNDLHCVVFRWNVIIGQSSAIMKALPLSLSGSWLRNVKDLKRKYHTIKIDNHETWNENAYKVLSKHGVEMRRLELSECYIEDESIDLLKRTFDTFARLESLVLSSVETFTLLPDSPIQPANLPNLKKVVMNDTDFCVSRNLKIMQCQRFSTESANFLADFESREVSETKVIENQRQSRRRPRGLFS
jgi:hypothetical protein